MSWAKTFRAALVFLITGFAAALLAQTTQYPDSPSGLEKLAKDIMKAQRENDGARAGALLDGLVLPNYQQWYRENFDDDAFRLTLPVYAANSRTISMQLARFFGNAQQQNFTALAVKRFDKSCDDNASEQTFNTLDARLKDVPLYELRFINGGRFLRLFAFVYVDGGFRYVLTPDFNAPPPKRPPMSAANPKPPADSNSAAASGPVTAGSEAREITADSAGEGQRVRMGGAVQAAKLVHRVQPLYPEVARNELLSGTVRLHAIIAKDGTIKTLRVVSGRCSLARASINAVRQWRYSPTLINGQPVEIDTTIDVIFSLRQ